MLTSSALAAASACKPFPRVAGSATIVACVHPYALRTSLRLLMHFYTLAAEREGVEEAPLSPLRRRSRRYGWAECRRGVH